MDILNGPVLDGPKAFHFSRTQAVPIGRPFVQNGTSQGRANDVLCPLGLPLEAKAITLSFLYHNLRQ